jgi:asparagine synthase (glutamine-hydrolysing)
LMLRALWRGSEDASADGDYRCEQLVAHVGWTHRGYEAPCIGWNRRRDLCLVFVGEDFDLKQKIAALGTHSEAPESDAESLLRLYEKEGPDFVAALNGRFAGLLFDLRTGAVSLFNDRYGLNRLYIHEAIDGVAFSSEAKSLLAVLPQSREIDQQGLAEFFSVGCVLQNRTLFKNISLLPPASWWTFQRDGTLRRGRYFDPRTWENQEPVSATEYEARLADVFGRVAPKYLGGRAPVAMSLTGGLDSRMLLAWAPADPGKLPCYTFGGPYRDCADVRIARRLARIVQQPHTTIRIEKDFFASFASLAENTIRATDGAMDISGAVELYANRRARQIAPIRLTGNYGSELLRSNVAFRPGTLDQSLFTPEFRRLIDGAAETYRTEAAGQRLSFIAFKQVPWHHYGRLAAECSQLTPRSPFLDNELVALAYRAPAQLAGSAGPILQLIATGNPSLDAVASDRALRARPTPLLGSIQKHWQEFTAKAEYAYDYGMPQWLARADAKLKAFQLERLFLGRHKFYHFRIWYRDQLSDTLRNQFSLREQPSCYISGAAERVINEHISGRANRTLELHKLLTVQLISCLLHMPHAASDSV